MVFGTPRYAIQSFIYANRLGWKPLMFVNSVSSAGEIAAVPPGRAARPQAASSVAPVSL
jgi:hypothetical protein